MGYLSRAQDNETVIPLIAGQNKSIKLVNFYLFSFGNLAPSLTSNNITLRTKTGTKELPLYFKHVYHRPSGSTSDLYFGDDIINANQCFDNPDAIDLGGGVGIDLIIRIDEDETELVILNTATSTSIVYKYIDVYDINNKVNYQPHN